MKGSEKLSVYIGTFIFVIIGFFIMKLLSDYLTAEFTDLAGSIISAIGWFVLGFVTYWGSTRWLESGEKMGMISLFFILIWLISAFGILIAGIIAVTVQTGTITLNLDNLIDVFFFWLPYALIPALATTLGVSNKSLRRD